MEMGSGREVWYFLFFQSIWNPQSNASVYLKAAYWIGRFQGPTSSSYNFALSLINTNKDKLQKEIWAKRGLHKSQTKIATFKK